MDAPVKIPEPQAVATCGDPAPRGRSSRARRAGIAVISIWAGWLALLPAGCGDDDAVVPAPMLQGITGRITNAGAPLHGSVMVFGGNWGDPGAVLATAPVDDQGGFEVPLPPGDYLLLETCAAPRTGGCNNWYAANGAAWSREEADTVRVLADHEATRADIRLGSLSIRQQMSPAMAGRTATVQLLDWQRRSAPASPRLRADAVIGNTGTLVVFLAAIPPGLYAVTITPEHGERVWLSSTGDPLRPDSVAVASDDVTVATGSLSARAVTVHLGFQRVFSEVAEFFPLLAVFDPDSNIVVYAGIDPGSRFRFDLFATRSFRLRISEGGLDRWVGGSGFHDATEFTVPPGAGDMELPPLSECGIVLDLVPPTPGMPVEPRLVIMDAAGKQTAWHPPFTHASRIPIPNLVPGAYRLYVAPTDPEEAGWLPQWYDRADSLASAAPVRLDQDLQRAEIQVRLQARRLKEPS